MNVKNWLLKHYYKYRDYAYVRFYILFNKKRSQDKSQADDDLDIIFKDDRHLYDSPSEKVKSISIRILKCIDFLAKKHHLNYFLAYGTLLGAIRHQDFIPWDDDIDIMMTRSDFNMFRSLAHELPSSLVMFPMGFGFFKIMDRYSIISKDGKRGVAVDIFIVEERNRKAQFYFKNVHTSRNVYLRDHEIYPLSSAKFGELNCPIPIDSDKMLKTLYGDYMTLPPEKDRVAPHSYEDGVHIFDFKRDQI